MKNIKNKITITLVQCAFLLIGALQVTGQKVELGLRFMPTFNTFEIATPDNGRLQTDFSPGFGIGGVLGVNRLEHFGIQGEVIYSTISQKYREANIDRKINLKYLNIPLLLSFNTGKTKSVNFNIVADPQIGLSVGSSLSGVGTDSTLAVLSVRKGDIGFAYGAGLDFAITRSHNLRFSLGFRGVYGLLDISDNSRTITTESYWR